MRPQVAVGTSQLGLRTLSVHAVCLSFFCNFSGIDPADFLILACLMIHLVPIARVTFVGLRNPRILLAVFAFFSSYTASALINGFNFSFVLNLIINLSLFLILISYCTSSTRVKRVVCSLFAGFGLSVVVAAFQVFDLLPLLPGQFDPVRHTRFFGLYGDPNLLGAAAVFFCIYWLNRMIEIDRTNVASIVMPAMFFAISFMTLVFTQSRSAWGGFVIAFLTCSFFIIKTLRLHQAVRAIGIGLILSGVLIVILYESGAIELVLSRLLTASDISTEAEAERFGLFYTAIAFNVAQDHPFGVGPGNTSRTTGLTSQDGDQIGAHNAFVQVAAENGWLAAFSFLYLMFRLLLNALKTSVRGGSPLGVSGRVMLGSLLSLTFCGFFQDLIQWKVAWVVPALYVAMILHERYPKSSSRMLIKQSEGSSQKFFARADVRCK